MLLRAVAILAAGFLIAADAPPVPEARPVPFQMQLVPVKVEIDSILALEKSGKKSRNPVIQEAREAGLDLLKPNHPLLPHSYRDGKLFYVFYKTTREAKGAQDYLLQRIRKEERYYASATDKNPRTVVTWLVEAFKLRDGSLKKADQHYGSYSLRNNFRREIIKEYEIGFGEIDGLATGQPWPFDRNVLYKEIQAYGPERALYDQVEFTQSRKWTLSVSFDKAGSYSVKSDEFGFDAPKTLPDTIPLEKNPSQRPRSG
jgi:hypothetical protein